MSLSSPWALVLLVVPAVLAALAVRALRRRTRSAVRFAHVDVLDQVAPAEPIVRRALPGALALAALAAMAIGFAGPHRMEDVTSERRQLMLAFDVSNSMMADDISPNRLEVARDAASSFLAQVPDDVDVGLVLFSGSVTLTRPPGTDRDVLLADLADTELSAGTAIGEAIYSSLSLLQAGAESVDEGTKGVIVVLSDGGTTVGRPDEQAAAAAVDAGVSVSTIAFGTDNGSITLPDTGEVVAVPYQPDALAAIARATGGTAASASDAERLGSIFDDLQATVTVDQREVSYAGWAFAAAFALVGSGMALSLVWLRRLG